MEAEELKIVVDCLALSQFFEIVFFYENIFQFHNFSRGSKLMLVPTFFGKKVER